MPIRPKNWEKFQHYKDRRPPWIRIYHNLLDDPDFWELKGEDVKRLVMIWLIASEHEGGILPAPKELAFRLRISVKAMGQTLARLSGWVEQVASNVLAEEQKKAPRVASIALAEKQNLASNVLAEKTLPSLPSPHTPYPTRLSPEAETEAERGTRARGALPLADTVTATVTEAAADWDADPAENIPEGLHPMQYAVFVLSEAAIPSGYALKVKTADAIEMLAKLESCTLPEATRRMLDRMQAAQKRGEKVNGFWLEDGAWKQTEPQEISTEGWE